MKETMTSKERFLIAIKKGQPDRVPVTPDISNMIPCRLTGKPFWDIYLYENPPLWRAYIGAVRYFGFDGWSQDSLDYITDPPVEEEKATEIVSRTAERIVERIVWHTPKGDLTGERTYYIADPPTLTKKPAKDIARDFPKLKYLFPEIVDYDSTEAEERRREIGDDGVFALNVGLPGFQGWFSLFDGGIEAMTYAYYDHRDLIEELREIHERSLIRQMEMSLDVGPDLILIGASGLLTLQSPRIFRELSLPTLKKLTRMAREAGIPTILHSCGKERDLVAVCVEETDLDCINPLEPPPMGDCDLGEIKRTYGMKISLMGNLHTTDVMLRGSIEDVERASKKAIDDAAAGGGFILSTGDQCGRDTPDANIFKMIDVARTYGRY
ncbi:MAG: uroporphyrinogen decarboxylase family protein [bacterium]